jgi:hypothetical protein
MIDITVPDFKVELTAQHDAPGCTITEGTISGTHLGPYLEFPASGNNIQIRLAALKGRDERPNTGRP